MTELNQSQIKARDHIGSNLLILAGAGTGKTMTIAERALNIAGTEGGTGLTLITFTKKAALTLKNRFEKVQGHNHHAFIGTFHAMCWRIILDFGSKLEIDSSWAIMDQDDSLRLMKMSSSGKVANDYLKLLSFSRNSGITVAQSLNNPRFVNMQRNRNSVIVAIEAYSRKTKLSKRLDFDSVLLIANKLLKDFADVRDKAQQQFKTILVDEYQDTNQLQLQLLKNLNTGKNITVVGDDAQSVYSFRAARIENILEFEDSFAADRINLDTNYRCPKNILNMAEASLSHNTQKLDRKTSAAIQDGPRPRLIETSDQGEEAERVAKEIKRLIDRGVLPTKICVLYRAGRLSLPIQQVLKRLKIRFVVPEEDDFFSLPHIKNVMTVLRLAAEPEDRIALAAIYDLLFPNNLAEFNTLDATADSRQTSIWDIIEDAADTKSLVNDLAERLTDIRSNDIKKNSVAKSLGLVIKLLEAPLKTLSGGGSVWQLWLADLSILQTLAQPFSSINDFLSTVFTQNVEKKENKDGVQFSTIHSAKGLEWDHVFVIGLVEFWFPMKLAIADQGNDEEERRLFYVASTRSRKELYLSTFKSNVTPFGRTMDQEISRFIGEISNYLDRI